MAGSNIPIDVFMYVNPETRVVDELYCVSPWGLTRREDGEWVPITRDESNIDEMDTYLVYELDWSTDYLAIEDAADDDDDDHAAIVDFDMDRLDEEGAKKYGILSIDPNSQDDDLVLEDEDL